MKAYAIIITIAFLLCLAIIFWPSSPSTENQTLINQRDDNLLQVVRKQKVIDSMTVEVTILKSEVVKSKAVGKLSEQALDKAKVNEKVLLKQIKLLSLSMSEIQADSAVLERFKSDPDSISQKVFLKLAKGDQCDSVRNKLEDFVTKLRSSGFLTDSLIKNQDTLLSTSISQYRILKQVASDDTKIIKIKTKENKTLKKGIKVGIGVLLLERIIEGIARSLK